MTAIIDEEEERAIAALGRLAKRWPKSLKLFSWSGTLVILKPGEGRTFHEATVGSVNIPNDGGDPNSTDECV